MLSAVSAILVARISFNGFDIANIIITISIHSEFLETRCCILANDDILSCADFLSRWSYSQFITEHMWVQFR